LFFRFFVFLSRKRAAGTIFGFSFLPFPPEP
jgi:hypothetical protein